MSIAERPHPTDDPVGPVSFDFATLNVGDSTTSHLRNLKQALGSWRGALEEFESALLELEETPDENGEAPKRSPNGQNRQNLRLLSLAEVCQELGEQRTVVYRRLSSGEIPSLKLGHALKVRQADLQEYMKSQQQHLRSLGEKNGSLGT